jgi:hypothetical protein
MSITIRNPVSCRELGISVSLLGVQRHIRFPELVTSSACSERDLNWIPFLGLYFFALIDTEVQNSLWYKYHKEFWTS